MSYWPSRLTSKKRMMKRIHEQFTDRVEYAPDFDNPQTYNEKIQWLKLNYRDPLIIQCADKYAVRDYVAETIGDKYLVDVLGIYTKAEDIDFDALPKKFVLKATNGWNKHIICTDKEKLNVAISSRIANKWLEPRSNHYYRSYEWNYKDIKPRIICEKYIEDIDNDDLKDYKIHCFNGKPKIVNVCSQRFTDLRVDWYDTDWNRLPFAREHDVSESSMDKPEKLDLMLKLAEQLSAPFPFVRVDFYKVKDRVLFGELTFTPAAGLGGFEPLEWDYRLGDMLELPKSKKRLAYFGFRIRRLLGLK